MNIFSKCYDWSLSYRYLDRDEFESTECLTSEQSSFLIEHWEATTGGNPQYGYDGVYFEGVYDTYESAWKASPPLDYSETYINQLHYEVMEKLEGN